MLRLLAKAQFVPQYLLLQVYQWPTTARLCTPFAPYSNLSRSPRSRSDGNDDGGGGGGASHFALLNFQFQL
ncbi:hypothetical protein ACLKA7_016233 [Drosophila subpalustris]